ncbi:MAG: DUF167 domain-containing protein [Myxococcota bacterium]
MVSARGSKRAEGRGRAAEVLPSEGSSVTGTASHPDAAVPLLYVQEGDALIFSVHAQPGASRDGLLGVVEGVLKLRISAPPVDGAANERLLRYLAKEVLHVRPAALALVSGEQSRHKRLRVTGLSPEVLLERLRELLPKH